MKFDRLRLLGFKTFVEPTEMPIQPGITGIVGPNGCGKSNLVEALRWVMGESSYKSMRASGMEDVIFSGSGSRPPRNFAEVSLIIDNAERKAPATFNDQDQLEVTRRIEREAGSAYKVNNRDVRARDVQILFADASTGSRSPALVRQGMIGELINAKPQSRRRLLEEAAGISGLHSRRHEAELRLRAAETNLERLNDVIGQLEAQLQGLKRQARHAARYKQISADIRKNEALLLHLKWAAINALVKQDETALEAQTRLVGERTQASASSSKDRAVVAHALPGLREKEAEAAAALQRIKLARESLEQEGQRARQRIEEITRRLAQFRQDREREHTMIADMAQSLAALDEEETGLNEEQNAAAGQEEAAKEALEAARQTLQASEEKLSGLIDASAQMKARRHQLETTVREQSERLTRMERQLEEVQKELDAVAVKVRDNADVQRFSHGVRAAGEAVLKAEQDAKRAEQRSATAKEREAALREPLRTAEREAQRLETEAATLVKVLNVEGNDLWPPLVDAVQVQKGLEAAIGAVFGDDLDAPADKAAPMHWELIRPEEQDPLLPPGVRSLSDFVKAPDVLARRLSQTGLVDRLKGKALQRHLKPGQRLVSRDGDVWRWDGYTATAEAPTAAAQRLAQRNRLADLELEAKAAAAEAEAARTEFEAAAANARSMAQQEVARRQAWHEAQTLLGEARERLSAAERAVAQETARMSALEEAKVRLGASVEEAVALKRDAVTGLEGIGDAGEMDKLVAETRDQVGRERAVFAENKALYDGLKRESEIRSNRLKAIGTERQRWRQRSASGAQHIEELDKRQAEASAELAKLQGVPEELETKQRALLTQIAEAEKRRSQAGDAVAEAETKLNQADKANRDADGRLAEAREELARLESRLEAERSRRAEIGREIADQLDTAPERLLALAGLGAQDPLPDVAATEARLEKLAAERERIGAVNLRAEEESGDLEEQLGGLRTEREDLEAAIRKLRHAIGQLNREGRERLLAAFETVNEHFQNLFVTLFGGGAAELQLTESDDPLEAGLEILARPPGKKPQTLSLLSGGEQALTALALIFAVFLTNPAPICVLDEVDAPLDDANVERFCNLVDEMTRATDTRFLIVTHHPITMSRMNRLFGVTMSERGVSQLVSVDLETAESFREAS